MHKIHNLLKRVYWPALFLFGGTFAAVGYVSLRIFHDHPYCMDEYNYAYQAKIFASGRLFVPMEDKFRPLVELYMVLVDGRLFSKYAPLWPAVLSIGEWAGWPGLVNPLLSAITAFLVYRIAETFVERRLAFLSAVVFASTSYFIGYGASYFSQPLALTLSTAGLYFYRLYELYGQRKHAVLVGAAAGALCLGRPGDAFCMAAAMAIAIATLSGDRRRRLADVLLLGGVASVGAILLVGYNHLLTGKWSIAAYEVSSEFRQVDPEGAGALSGLWSFVAGYFKELEIAKQNLLRGVLDRMGWAFPLFVGLGFALGRGRFRWIVALHTGLLFAIYNLHPGFGWPQYGARYWYPSIGGLGVVGALGLAFLQRSGTRRGVLAIAMSALLIQVTCLIRDLRHYQWRFDSVMTVQADIYRHIPTPSIVVLTKPPPDSAWFRRLPDFTFQWEHFKRNMFMAGPNQYVLREASVPRVRQCFPDLPVARYAFDAAERTPEHPPLLKATRSFWSW